MVLASCRVTIYLSEGRSLKDKRRVTRGLLGRLRERHNVSAVELEDGRDLWQRAELGFALAARDRAEAESQVERLRADVEELSQLKQVEFSTEYL